MGLVDRASLNDGPKAGEAPCRILQAIKNIENSLNNLQKRVDLGFLDREANHNNNCKAVHGLLSKVLHFKVQNVNSRIEAGTCSRRSCK